MINSFRYYNNLVSNNFIAFIVIFSYSEMYIILLNFVPVIYAFPDAVRISLMLHRPVSVVPLLLKIKKNNQWKNNVKLKLMKLKKH